MFEVFSPNALAWVAGGLYALGYLIINQTVLRLFVLAGTAVYVWYYYVAAETPLWDAILVSYILGAANLIGLANLYLHRSRMFIPNAHLDVYDTYFAHMPPADFRAMMRLGQRRTLDAPMMLTQENAKLSELHFVLDGDLTIEKLGECFKVSSGVFVGEIAYLTGRRSSATTHVPPGADVITWQFDDLRRWTGRRPRAKLAFEAMISRDLAAKVVFAVAPHQKDWDVEAAVQAERQA